MYYILCTEHVSEFQETTFRYEYSQGRVTFCKKVFFRSAFCPGLEAISEIPLVLRYIRANFQQYRKKVPGWFRNREMSTFRQNAMYLWKVNIICTTLNNLPFQNLTGRSIKF